MTDTAFQPIDIMLVLPGEDLWGAERLRADLAQFGLRLISRDEFRGDPTSSRLMPAAILAFLSGQSERDAVLCRRWACANLAPVVAVSSNTDEGYVLALFAAGVEDVIPRPVRPRELAARIRSILRRTRPELALPRPDLAPPIAPASVSARKSSFTAFIHGLQSHFSARRSKKGVRL